MNYFNIYNYINILRFKFVAMINKKIIKIRKKLDKLDDLLLNIIKKNSFSNQVLLNKKLKKILLTEKDKDNSKEY